MLEGIATQKITRRVFRLRSMQMSDGDEKRFWNEHLNDLKSESELRNWLSKDVIPEGRDESLDEPFKINKKFKRQTRFSDGSFAVFYSSLDPLTANAEIRHWLPIIIGKPQTMRKVYYQQFSCKFAGDELDLRPKISDWPDLIHESDYTFCNRIGAEAVSLKTKNVDGILTFSARRNNGENMPIFSRNALSDVEFGSVLVMTYNPSTEEVEVDEI